jgi:hypothetical protein
MALINNYQEAADALGVAPGANKKEIEKAYKKKSLKHHPDKWKSNSKQGKSCKNLKCGSSNDREKWFCSTECKETYEKIERNWQRVQELITF